MNHRSREFRRGVTLIELLVMILVIAVLIGILAPSLSRLMLSRNELICTARLRTVGSVVLSYGLDHRDSFPSWIRRGEDYTNDRSLWPEFSAQWHTFFLEQSWLDYAGFLSSSESQYCPSNTWYPEAYEQIAASDFWMTSSAYIEPAYLDPKLNPRIAFDRLGGRVQRHTNTWFPSSKVGMFEMFVWHGWKGDPCPDCPVADLEYHNADREGSVFFLDGHTELRDESSAVRAVRRTPIWAPYTYTTTPHGLHGRDFE